MNKVTIPIFIQYEPVDPWNTEKSNAHAGMQFEVSMFKNSHMAEFKKMDLEVEIPSGWDPTEKIVGMLREKKRLATEEFTAKVAEINESLEKYLALESNHEE